MLISELNIGHLSEAEQNSIVDGLGEVLLRRVMLKLFNMLPENEKDNFQNLLKEQKGPEADALLAKHVPNASDIIREEMRAGIDEHKKLVKEELAKSAA